MPNYSSTELQLTRNTEDCIAAPHRNFEADSAAPWQRAPPLDHVQVAAVRAAWYQWWSSLRAPGGETPLRAMLLTTWCLYYSCVFSKTMYLDRQRYTVFWPYTICRPNTKTKRSRTRGHACRFFFWDVSIRNSLRSNYRSVEWELMAKHKKHHPVGRQTRKVPAN